MISLCILQPVTYQLGGILMKALCIQANTYILQKDSRHYYLYDKKKKEKYPLKPVTKEDLQKFRKTEDVGFLFRYNQNLFLATLSKSVPALFSNQYNRHLCSYCRHCSAASDEKGGCQKVRDAPEAVSYLSDFYNKREVESPLLANQQRKMLENYPFISLGYQTIHLCDKKMCFAVLQCVNYEKD